MITAVGITSLNRPGRLKTAGTFYEGKKLIKSPDKERDDGMPTSKKELGKLNRAKKEKAEELAKLVAGGSQAAKKKLKKLEKKIK